VHGELLERDEEGHDEVLLAVLEARVGLLVLDRREGPELVQLGHLGVAAIVAAVVVRFGLLATAEGRRRAAAAAHVDLAATGRLQGRLDAHQARLALLAGLRVLVLDLLHLLGIPGDNNDEEQRAERARARAGERSEARRGGAGRGEARNG